MPQHAPPPKLMSPRFDLDLETKARLQSLTQVYGEVPVNLVVESELLTPISRDRMDRRAQGLGGPLDFIRCGSSSAPGNDLVLCRCGTTRSPDNGSASTVDAKRRAVLAE